MLASITPLGERGRGATWAVTISAFVLGASAAGAGAGALLGALGGAALGAVSDRSRLAMFAVVLVAAVVLDLRPSGAPGPRRQVNERWLDEFRGWIYGLGFGAQLGIGISTVVSSAATYAAWLCALITGSVTGGAIVLGCFGAVRGLTPLLAARVRRPEQLLALHGRLERWRGPAARLELAALLLTLAAALAGALA